MLKKEVIVIVAPVLLLLAFAVGLMWHVNSNQIPETEKLIAKQLEKQG